MNAAEIARLDELDRVYWLIVDRTADQLMPEGASKMAARANRKSRVKRTRQGPTIRKQARDQAEDFLAELAERRPDDETLQRFARISRERATLRGMMDALTEHTFGGTVPKQLDRATAAPTLAGLTEIAAMLGVSRQRVHQLHRAGKMPEPLAQLSAGPVWQLDTLEPWAAARRRKVSRETAPAGSSQSASSATRKDG